MTSKESLEQIMEKYIFYVPARSEGKEHLINCLNIIAKDLERLEKIEENYYSLNISCEEIEFENVRLEEENKKLKQVIEILKDELWLYENGDYRLSVMGSHDYQALSKMDYELLKEVFENDDK